MKHIILFILCLSTVEGSDKAWQLNQFAQVEYRYQPSINFFQSISQKNIAGGYQLSDNNKNIFGSYQFESTNVSLFSGSLDHCIINCFLLSSGSYLPNYQNMPLERPIGFYSALQIELFEFKAGTFIQRDNGKSIKLLSGGFEFFQNRHFFFQLEAGATIISSDQNEHDEQTNNFVQLSIIENSQYSYLKFFIKDKNNFSWRIKKKITTSIVRLNYFRKKAPSDFSSLGYQLDREAFEFSLSQKYFYLRLYSNKDEGKITSNYKMKYFDIRAILTTNASSLFIVSYLPFGRKSSPLFELAGNTNGDSAMLALGYQLKQKFQFKFYGGKYTEYYPVSENYQTQEKSIRIAQANSEDAWFKGNFVGLYLKINLGKDLNYNFRSTLMLENNEVLIKSNFYLALMF